MNTVLTVNMKKRAMNFVMKFVKNQLMKVIDVVWKPRVPVVGILIVVGWSGK